MSIGEHSVLLYPDPTAGGWSDVGIYNPSFDLGVDGWVAAPFTNALAAPTPGLVRQVTDAAKPTPGIQQADARVPARPATGLFRATYVVKASGPLLWGYGMHFGDTQHNAALGPYWAGADHAVGRVAYFGTPSGGTYTLDMTVNPDDVPAVFGYVSPHLAAYPQAGVTVDYLSVSLEYLVGESLDMTCLVDEVSIQHGRDDTTAQPEASAATIELDLTGETLPALADIGSILTVQTNVGTEGGASTRFFGRITDVNVGWDDAGEATPDTPVGQIVATSLLADLGRRVVGDEPWPKELDGARVARILNLAGLDPDPATSDPGTVQLNPRDVDARAALEVAQEAAESAGGIVWQTRNGDVRYADSSHRKGIPSSLQLDACDILVTPTWSRTTQGLINRVTVSYGLEPEGGEQPTVRGQNDVSIARYDLYDYSLTSDLAELADAQAMVGLLLARNSSPVWVMTSLPVDVKGLDDDRTNALLGLEMHSLLTLTGLPLIVPTAPTSANLWVEGWEERLSWGEHEIELHVSGYCRTVPAPQWDDVAPDWTWDAMGDLTWDEAACFGPPTQHGRWADVPASMRWDTTDPAVTWDTWPH